MKITITIEVPEHTCFKRELESLDYMNQGNREPYHLRLLLIDALSEFRAKRVSACEYVNARYPDQTLIFREGKIEQVKTRKSIANALLTYLKVENIEVEP